MSFRWPEVLLLLGAVGAALQPKWGVPEETIRQQGVDLLVCLDVSYSMRARDLPPDRLERARQELQALVEQLGSDRIGLILVAGDAQRVAPLTADHHAFLALLEDAAPERLRQGGTDLAAALLLAQELLEAAPSAQPNLLLISDGEDREGRALEQALVLREAGIRLSTLAVGTERGGRITLQDEEGREYFLRDPEGKEVLTRLDRGSLDALAQTTGGQALAIGAEVGVLQDWYGSHLLPEAREAARANPSLERAPRFQLPLGLALLGAFLSLAGTGRRRIG